MAQQSSFYITDGVTRTYPSSKHIASKQHVAVYFQSVTTSTWSIIEQTLYDLVNNSIVFTDAPDSALYSQIEIRVADTAAELTESPSDIATVAGAIADVTTVAGSITAVETVSSNTASVTTVSGSIANINTVATNIANVNTVAGNNSNVTTVAGISGNVTTVAGISANVTTVATNSASVNTVAGGISNVNSVATNILDVNAVATTVVPNIAEILLADNNAAIATTKASEASASATSAQLKAWESEAERLTAESYATEAEDVPVNIVTSDGDGTFTYTPTSPAEYSALHWRNKAALLAFEQAVNVSFTPAGNISATDVQAAIQELDTEKAPTTNPTFTGTVSVDSSIVFEGSTADAYETTLTVADPTADRTLSLPNESGTLATQEYVDGKMVVATSVTATGTAVDFTGIPSWAKRITVMFDGVSTNGSSNYLIQLGDSGGIENTSYMSCSVMLQNATAITALSGTAGFSISALMALGEISSGNVYITKLSGNTWTYTSTVSDVASTGNIQAGSGSKTLSGTLDRIRITTVNGTDRFDAGTINIMYEG